MELQFHHDDLLPKVSELWFLYTHISKSVSDKSLEEELVSTEKYQWDMSFV